MDRSYAMELELEPETVISPWEESLSLCALFLIFLRRLDFWLGVNVGPV